MTTPDTPFVIRADDERGVTTLTLNRPAAFNALSAAALFFIALAGKRGTERERERAEV